MKFSKIKFDRQPTFSWCEIKEFYRGQCTHKTACITNEKIYEIVKGIRESLSKKA